MSLGFSPFFRTLLEATRARNEISDLVESIPDGFEAFDPAFRLTFMNRAAEGMLERSDEELALGRSEAFV